MWISSRGEFSTLTVGMCNMYNIIIKQLKGIQNKDISSQIAWYLLFKSFNVLGLFFRLFIYFVWGKGRVRFSSEIILHLR